MHFTTDNGTVLYRQIHFYSATRTYASGSYAVHTGTGLGVNSYCGAMYSTVDLYVVVNVVKYSDVQVSTSTCKDGWIIPGTVLYHYVRTVDATFVFAVT